MLEDEKFDKEENRLDGLKLKKLQSSPLKQLKAWAALHVDKLNYPLNSIKTVRSISALTIILIFIVFILGLSAGYGLISYSGQKPINVIHFLFIGVVFPLLTLILTLIAMFKNKKTHSDFLIHISPAFWLDKMIEFFPSFKINFKPTPLILNWLIINRAQYLTISFLFGILAALILSVISKDLAFGWSTTLDISTDSFYGLLKLISTPWSWLFHSAAPSIELVQKSQFYRLGGILPKEYIANAKLLGNWWQFLVFSILFWGILPRIFLVFITNFLFGRVIDKSYLKRKDSRLLLKNMNETMITTHALDDEKEFSKSDKFSNIKEDEVRHISTIIGWGLDKDTLNILFDYKNMRPSLTFLAGGNNSLEEDENIIKSIKDNPLVIIKSWEPPTTDFTDFIEELSQKVDKIEVLPIGIKQNSYTPTKKDIDIWSRKLKDFQNIWIII